MNSPYFIINRIGAVHRTGAYCQAAARAELRVPVNDKQMQVYGLARCAACFPTVYEFAKVAIGRSAA